MYCSISDFQAAQIPMKYKTPCDYMLIIMSLFCTDNDTDA